MSKSTGSLIVNMLRAEAESYFLIGQPAKGDACFETLIDRFPQSPWGYIGWGDMYSIQFNEKLVMNHEKARQIFQMAIERKVDEVEIVELRLANLKKNQG